MTTLLLICLVATLAGLYLASVALPEDEFNRKRRVDKRRR